MTQEIPKRAHSQMRGSNWLDGHERRREISVHWMTAGIAPEIAVVVVSYGTQPHTMSSLTVSPFSNHHFEPEALGGFHLLSLIRLLPEPS